MSELRELRSLLNNSQKAEEWLIAGIRQIQYEDIKHAIDKNLLADDLLFSYFEKYMTHPIIAPVIRCVFRVHWPAISHILCDVREVRKIIVENRPEFMELLGNKESISWLNTCVRRGYDRLYNFTWK